MHTHSPSLSTPEHAQPSQIITQMQLCARACTHTLTHTISHTHTHMCALHTAHLAQPRAMSRMFPSSDDVTSTSLMPGKV
jgi:hypothetical protein